MYKIIVSGSRDFSDYNLLKTTLDSFIENHPDNHIVIISGTARGADKMGEKYARERGYQLLSYPADWKRYGKMAGFIRNGIMAKNGDALVAFWDGESKGTKNMISLAGKHNLDTKVIKYKELTN